jgi:hypothetical protein
MGKLLSANLLAANGAEKSPQKMSSATPFDCSNCSACSKFSSRSCMSLRIPNTIFMKELSFENTDSV